MAPRYLLDTNICIYIRRKAPPKVLAHFQKLQTGDAAISLITYGELAYGMKESAEPDRAAAGLKALATLLPVLPLPDSAALAYGTIRSQLEIEGRPIGANDLWIAAHALAAGLTLVTNNEREFQRVKNLKIENWAK